MIALEGEEPLSPCRGTILGGVGLTSDIAKRAWGGESVVRRRETDRQKDWTGGICTTKERASLAKRC